MNVHNQSMVRRLGGAVVALLQAGWLMVPLGALAQPVPAPRPLAHFANLPLITQMALSPNGQRYAAIVNSGDETRVVTRSLAEPQPQVALSTDNREVRIRWMRWLNDERLAISVIFDARRGSVSTAETRLLSVRFDGGGQIPLVQRQPGGRLVNQFQDEVVDWMEDEGQRVLMQLQDERTGRRDLFSIDVASGERRRVASTAWAVGRWLTDAQHRPRVIVRGVDKDEVEVMTRYGDGDDGNWRALWRFDGHGDAVVTPLGFGRDPERLYVQALHQGRKAVFEVDLKSPGLDRRLVLAHPDRDVSGRLMRSAQGEVLGIVDAESPSTSAWWDPDARDLAAAVNQVLPDRANHLLQISRDGQRYLVHSAGNGVPGRFYLGDRQTGRLMPIGSQYPALDTATWPRKMPMSVRARDGLVLQALLTRPTSAAPGPLPMVLLPHGGPAAQDRLEFDPLVAFLADRGYVVLQLNFRGSAGVGREFQLAGAQRWGLEMQDDLTDAAHWAIGEKVADPKRICIVGGSYGGYAALMGAVKTPDLFRCAVSLNGISDLFELYEHESRFVGGRQALEKLLGHAWQDRERLRATSPALQAVRVKSPVLLVHGVQDRRVPVEQSRTMARALADAGKPHRLLELPEGDHTLSRQPARLAFYKALEEFLGQHLSSTSP